MSRSSGTGYPIFFMCPVERQERTVERYRLAPRVVKRHRPTLTGRTRPAPSPGKGNPRKSKLSREYVCSCGKVGWSCHKDLERLEAHDA